jgi:hypothetical protein
VRNALYSDGWTCGTAGDRCIIVAEEMTMLNLNELGKYRENNRIEAKKAQGGLIK